MERFPIESRNWVRLVYTLASDGDGSFDAPEAEPNDLESPERLLATAGLLIQAATAELLKKAGRERETFRLQFGADGYPIVSTIRLQQSMAQLHGMSVDAAEGWTLQRVNPARLSSEGESPKVFGRSALAFAKSHPRALISGTATHSVPSVRATSLYISFGCSTFTTSTISVPSRIS